MLDTRLVGFILSQFFGLYLSIVAIIMLYRVREFRQVVQGMKPQSGTILLGGLLGLMLGLFFVGIHNVWVFGPTVIITAIGWLITVISVLFLSSPERMVLWMGKLFAGSSYYVFVSMMLGFGLMLLVRGIYLYATHQHNFFFL